MAHVAARNECHAPADACRSVCNGFAKLNNFQMVRKAQTQHHDRSVPSRFSDKPKRHYCAVVERQVSNWSCPQTTLRGLMRNLSRKRYVVLEIYSFPVPGHALNSGARASRLFFRRRKGQTVPESG